jgi:hypothetical protein
MASSSRGWQRDRLTPRVMALPLLLCTSANGQSFEVDLGYGSDLSPRHLYVQWEIRVPPSEPATWLLSSA